MLSQYQMGWWGAQFAGVGGAFTAPYPTLTVTHLPRPIRQLKVVGDTAREEYPVDFTIKLYAQDDTLLKTETVTGNTQVSWSKTLDSQVLDVAKQVLTITKWSHEGRCAKIIEFFTSIREVYETGDLVSIRLLEEREASQGSLPVGNVSANEIVLALNNEDGKFDVDNEMSPLANLLKANRRIRAWLGTELQIPFIHEEDGGDFATGELDGVVVGEDGLELEEEDVFAKLDDPSSLPTGNGYGCAFDSTGTYLAVAHDSSPYITIYKRDGDTFTKLANPATRPTGTGYGCAFDPTGTYLAVAHSGSPYITIYKRSGDTFTKLANPSTLPASTGNGCAFDPTGTYLAVAHNNSPRITIYKRSGDTFTKMADPATLPTGNGQGCAFDPTGTYLAVAHSGSPYITIYKRSGDTFTKVDNPATRPTGNGRGCAFDPTGTYLAVTHLDSPYITIYKRSGDTFTKLANPSK
jgi:sugar lactone lactonase YvrE